MHMIMKTNKLWRVQLIMAWWRHMVFFVNLTALEMPTVCAGSSINYRRMLLRKRRRFWDIQCIDSAGTWSPTFGIMPNALPFKLLGPNICYSMFWPHFSPLRVQGIHVTRNITMTYQNRIRSAEVEWMQNSYKMCHTTIILWKLEWQQRIMLYRMFFRNISYISILTRKVLHRLSTAIPMGGFCEFKTDLFSTFAILELYAI